MGGNCEEEETIIHFFTCPEIRSTFDKLKHVILSFTENENRFPPVTDIQFLLGDFSASKTKAPLYLYKYEVLIAGEHDHFYFIFSLLYSIIVFSLGLTNLPILKVKLTYRLKSDPKIQIANYVNRQNHLEQFK